MSELNTSVLAKAIASKTPASRVSRQIERRAATAGVHDEFDGKELQGFAAVFGVYGVPNRGDSEKVSNEWYLSIQPADAERMIASLKSLGYRIGDGREVDGYLEFTKGKVAGELGFNVFAQGDCILTITGV